MYWQVLQPTETATESLLHSENERQWSVNDFYQYIFGILYSNWFYTSIHVTVAAFKGKNNCDMLPAAA
jgi:hypothetical protein